MLNQEKHALSKQDFIAKLLKTLHYYIIIIYLNKKTWVKNSFQSLLVC